MGTKTASTVPMRPSTFAVSALLLAVLAFGCGDDAQTPSAPTTPAAPSAGAGGGGTGTLTLRITDSPFSEARAVLVTFNEVSVHRSGAGWETLPFFGGAGQRTCDLKKLQGPTDLLGVGTLPSGHYTQIRLHVVSASIHFDNASAGGPCATSDSRADGPVGACGDTLRRSEAEPPVHDSGRRRHVDSAGPGRRSLDPPDRREQRQQQWEQRERSG